MNSDSESCSCCCCATIAETERGIMQNCGKFSGIIDPGFACFCWPFTKIAGNVSTKLRQILIKKEAKTKDNVFVHISISVQFLVEEDNVKLSFYSMQSPRSQMEAFVDDAIRTIVPTMELEHLFLEKEKISTSIKDELAKKMTEYGWSIMDTLVIEIDPDAKVKAAMNRINEAKRLREAAEFEAETAKVVKVKEAEAEAISKKLQGEGVAGQRKAILAGFQDSIGSISKSIGVSPEETLKYTMLTQYFDMLRDIGTSPNKSTIFVPHLPGSVGNLSDQISSAMMQTNVMTKE